MSENPLSDGPDDADVLIWNVQDHDVDVYRVLRGTTVRGEFSGRSIGSTVFGEAVKHSEPAIAGRHPRRYTVAALHEFGTDAVGEAADGA